MGRGVEHRVGGILGLCRLLDEYGEAIEYDLLTLGRRLDDLGTPSLSWRDLYVITRHLPPTSALRRAAGEGEEPWTTADYLLALAVDALNGANWQRAGKSSAPRPRPIPRPGETAKGEQYGSDPIPVAEFDSWWDNPEGT